ncbi:FAD-dependent oxidoreductase [Campylobacter sp. RM12654]|uniref:NAD(P)/FAD-dependent oxidoreductase n=1 Tax=unclassified Campylobacter TaxID=2593542 RepID=UPI001BDA7460|nr:MULTISPECIES: FAD-dependent oxidoreductase [unclassified Campylobacter]MBT0883232.1 FAD-dependent oxidoreductase [Campylobacter sp. 2018MI13]MBZ7977588.1 FAD-dependent oxidoreductase [Campylobacter sp. RM12654]MBZ7983398.1 FAD-dependent oxidoreductase [Campylobacter sp. RM12647]ULO03180.1 NADH dehydrogenase [Campylobacter sp. RM12651]
MKKIVFLGAGYANLSLIKKIKKKNLRKAEFILINNNSYHYKTTELHKIAARESEKDIVINLKSILPKDITLICDNVKSIENGKVICENANYDYDELYVGLGASVNTFGIDGLDECLNIINYKNALKTAETLYKNLELYENKNVIICGAGLSGVELCGSIATTCKNLGISINLYLVEAMDEILPVYTKDLAKKARNYLENLGVKVLSSHKIIKKVDDKLFLNDENNYIKAKTIIFTAGVKGSEVIANSGFNHKNNRVLVNEYLMAPNFDNCYVLGDLAIVSNFAPTAQIACKQGKYLAKRLNARLEGIEFNEPFKYNDKGSICSVGKDYAIGVILGKTYSGFMAKSLKKLTEIEWSETLK